MGLYVSTRVEMMHFSANLLKMHFLCAARELPFQVTSACGSVLASNLSHLLSISALSLSLSPFTVDKLQSG